MGDIPAAMLVDPYLLLRVTLPKFNMELENDGFTPSFGIYYSYIGAPLSGEAC